MSRRRLRIQVVFEPTRRGSEPMQAAYQMTIPEQRRTVQTPEETLPTDNMVADQGEADRSR